MDKNIVSQQLTAASQVILSCEGVDFCSGVLDVCGELINIVAAQLCNDEINTESIKDITSGVIYVSKGLENIAAKAGGADCLKVSTEYVGKLANAEAERKRLVEEEANAKINLSVVTADIDKLKPQVETLQTEFNNQTEFKSSLERKLEEFSDENIQALKDSNEVLLDEILKKQEEHKKLCDKQTEHNNTMAELDRMIAAMPTEKALADAYDERDAYYKHLLTAKEECSEEKRLALDNEIRNLNKEVEGLEVQMNTIRQTKANFESAKTRIATEKGIFETEFIQKLEESMDDLKNNMSDHRSRLNAIKDNAEELQKHIDECDAIRRNYSFMFDANNVALRAIAAAGQIEYAELAKTYDITKSEHVKTMTTDIKKNLDELSKIINECKKAATADQEALRVKSGVQKG